MYEYVEVPWFTPDLLLSHLRREVRIERLRGTSPAEIQIFLVSELTPFQESPCTRVCFVRLHERVKGWRPLLQEHSF